MDEDYPFAMPPKRVLPEDRNPELAEKNAPPLHILVERRCLGQTELKVKPGQVGTTNATKPDNLGVLDYAHLRVPLPGDLTSSGIFSRQANRKWPEAYFLMRRSTDGFISATGMFKAAFPWAQQDEEANEKDYIKGLDTTSSEEVAGNVWIHPEQALALADEYGIRVWIAALLDPEPIVHGTGNPKKKIKSPPPYKKGGTEMLNGEDEKEPEPSPSKKPVSPKASPKSTRKTDGRRSVRGKKQDTAEPESPTKKTPARKIATPKPRARKGRGAKSDAVTESSDALQAAINGEPQNVKVEVETESKPTVDGDEEVEHTKVNIEMPSGHPDLELPKSAEGMLEKAREMVKEAEKVAGPSSGKGKRKADEITAEDGEVASPDPSSKRTKTVALELRKERITRRAITGIVASLAIGALVPTAMNFLGA